MGLWQYALCCMSLLAVVWANQCNGGSCNQNDFRGYTNCLQNSCNNNCQCSSQNCNTCSTTNQCCQICCQTTNNYCNCPNVNCQSCQTNNNHQCCNSCCQSNTITPPCNTPPTNPPPTPGPREFVVTQKPIVMSCPNITNIFKPNFSMPNISITINQPPIHITTGPVINNVTLACGSHPGVQCPAPNVTVVQVPHKPSTCCNVPVRRCVRTHMPQVAACYPQQQQVCGPQCVHPQVAPCPGWGCPIFPQYYPVPQPQPPQPCPSVGCHTVPYPQPQPCGTYGCYGGAAPGGCVGAECQYGGQAQMPQYNVPLQIPQYGGQAQMPSIGGEIPQADSNGWTFVPAQTLMLQPGAAVNYQPPGYPNMGVEPYAAYKNDVGRHTKKKLIRKKSRNEEDEDEDDKRKKKK